jgi:uncharacterized membrane protein YcaP (DUF421 family)
MFRFGIPPWELALRSIVIYGALLVGLRLFGKREIGQFTIYYLVFVLLVANALQPAMTGPDNSLVGGLLIMAVLVLLNFGVARLDRFGLFHRLIAPQPTIIIRNGHYLPGPLKQEGVDQEEVDTAIREHGLDDVSQVGLGVLEPDGSISIVGAGAEVSRTKRRVHYHRRF